VLIGSLKDAYGPIYDKLTKARQAFNCKLPKDVDTRIRALITLISNESSNAVKKVNVFYAIVIFVTIWLLIIFLYLTIYLNNNTYTLIFFIVSTIIIIIAALLLLFGANSIYNTSTTNVTNYLSEIGTIVTDIKLAGEQGLCCLGLNCTCPTC
jgi:heme/copper-type cytochrome/quinol oxidase subunit 4